MKNSRFARLVAVFLSLALIVGAGAVIMALADDATQGERLTTSEVGVVGMNVAYEAQTELIFAVEDSRAVKDGKVYLLFFKSAPDEDATGKELYDAAAARKTAEGVMTASEFYGEDLPESEEKYYVFHSNGINAADFGVAQYVVPVIVGSAEQDGQNVVTYTIGYTQYDEAKAEDERYTYTARAVSVVNYAVQKYNEERENDSLDAAHEELYRAMVEFGYSAALKKWGAEEVGNHFKVQIDDKYGIVPTASAARNMTQSN